MPSQFRATEKSYRLVSAQELLYLCDSSDHLQLTTEAQLIHAQAISLHVIRLSEAEMVMIHTKKQTYAMFNDIYCRTHACTIQWYYLHPQRGAAMAVENKATSSTTATIFILLPVLLAVCSVLQVGYLCCTNYIPYTSGLRKTSNCKMETIVCMPVVH